MGVTSFHKLLYSRTSINLGLCGHDGCARINANKDIGCINGSVFLPFNVGIGGFMFETLTAIWAVVYVAVIIKSALELFQVRRCIRKLRGFLTAYERRNGCQRELNSLLRYYPVIARYENRPILSYNSSDAENSFGSKTLLSEFLMLRNFKRHKLFCSLNPLSALKAMVAFPATALSWFGFKPKRAIALLVSVVGWGITYILGLFSNEIKDFLISLLQKLVRI